MTRFVAHATYATAAGCLAEKTFYVEADDLSAAHREAWRRIKRRGRTKINLTTQLVNEWPKGMLNLGSVGF